VTNIAKSVFHQLLHYVGADIVRWSKVPENTLLGVVEYDIHTILDIGANIGQSARFYRQVFPNAFIYSFEPLSAAYKELDEWAQSQNGKVRALNVALGDHDGPMAIKEHVDFSPSSSFLESTRYSTILFPQTSRQKDVQVNIARLDDVAKDLEIKPEILVKMDVQGFEDRVIEGGKATLSQATACIMEVSLQPLYEGQPAFKDLCRLMDNLGFEYAGNILQIYDEKGRVIYLDALFRKPVVL
jgi:FkbM family methyltransferase